MDLRRHAREELLLCTGQLPQACRPWVKAGRSIKAITGKCALFLLCVIASLPGFAVPGNNARLRPLATKLRSGEGKGSLYFIENKGQVTDQYNQPRRDIQYKVEAGKGLNIFIGDGAIHYQFNDGGTGAAPGKSEGNMYRMDVELVGANKHAAVVTDARSPYSEHYVANGRDAAAQAFGRITYKNVYPHIDWVLYSSGGKLKHEFVIHKGGNAGDIKLVYKGAEQLRVKADGSLYASTPMGTITEDAPYAYQQDGQAVNSAFALSGNTLSYKTGAYIGDLVIDPALRWATYYGGSNIDGALDITADASGNIYMTGTTLSTNNIATTGAHLTTFSFVGFSIGFLVKFDSTGVRQWGTYYGSNTGTIPWSVVTDNSGNVYIGGGANSTTGISTTGAYQTANAGGTDAFLAKFGSDGTLLWGTYFGGAGGDTCFSIAIDGAGDIYTTGTTASTTGIATTGAYQTANGGGTDAYIAKFNSSGARLWATYFGGGGFDGFGACAVDPNNNIYICGNTSSTTGIASAGAFQGAHGGGSHDAFLAKFNGTGTKIWSTYYGGNGDEFGMALAADNAGHIYAGGRTFGSTTAFATAGAHQTTFGGTDDAFLMQFDTLGNRIWCTYYGGDSSEYMSCIYTIATGGIYVCGFTKSATGIATAGAYQTTHGADYDGYIARFNSAGVRQWGTYYGAAGMDGFGSVYFDGAGNLYAAGATKSTTGIATAGSHQSAMGGPGIPGDAFLAKFYDCVPDAGTIRSATTVGERFFIVLSESVSGGAWSVSNGNATISATGVLTGVTAGTVTVSYSVANSCGTAVITQDITVTATTGDITGSLGLCTGGATTLSFPGGGGTWVSGNTAVATVGVSSGIVSGVTVGTALITYTNGSGSIATTVTVGTVPDAGTITGASSVTVGNSITLSETVSGGVWGASNGNATVGSTGIVTGVAAGVVDIGYSVTNSCGTTVATTTLTVNPAVGPITGTLIMCAGATTTLTNSVSGGAWSSSNTAVATVSPAGVVSGVATGTAEITYAVTGGYATAIVTVDNSPSAISGTLALCGGNTSALGNTVAGGTWTSSNGSVATIGSATGIVSAIAAGNTTISYTLSSGCAATAIVTVGAGAGGIAGTATLCPGTTTTLSGSTTGGSWTGGTSTVATVGSTGVVTGIGPGTANITYSLGTGCRSTITVTVNTAPATITGTMKACPGTTTTLSNTTVGGTWSSSDATTATVDVSSGVVSGVVAGTVTISYVTGTGCYRTTTVTINPEPAAIVGAAVICAGSTVSLTDATPGLSWTSGNTAVATVGASTGVVTGVSTGMATITYTAASTNCITTAVITVNGVPAAIGGPATGCVGSDITLTNSVAGGTWSSSNIATATVDATTGVVTGVASGIVTITYTTGAGCFKTKQITINNSPSVSGYPTVCVGLTTTLSGGSGTWASGNPPVATVAASGGYVTGVSSGTAVMTFTAGSTGCPATYTVTVIPVPSAITGTTTACTGAVVTLSNTTPGGSWSSSNTAGATVGSATGIVNAVGTGGSVTISYAFGANCRVTTPFSLKPLPAVIAGTPSVCMPVTTTLTDATSAGTWSSSNTSIATVGTAISASYGLITGVSAGTSGITYTITSTGCARSTIVTVNAGLNPGTITSSGGFTLHTVSAPTSVTLSSTGASGGAWSSSNAGVATVNATTGVVTAVAAGTTTITYAVTASCTNTTTKVINVASGRPVGNQQSAAGSLQLYPNPTTGAFTLVSEEGGVLQVFSMDGKELVSYGVNAGSNTLSLPEALAAGVYLCKYTTDNGGTTMVRLVYER